MGMQNDSERDRKEGKEGFHVLLLIMLLTPLAFTS